MAILIEEGLHPNGMDLVKEARLNPVARANAEPQKMVRAISLGEGYAAIGLTLEPMISSDSDEAEPHFCAVLTVVGGRESELVPMMPVKVILGEVGRLPVSKVRAMIASAIDGPKESSPEVAQ